MLRTLLIAATLLLAAGATLMPTAAASPPTCEDAPHDHALIGYVECVALCVQASAAEWRACQLKDVQDP